MCRIYSLCSLFPFLCRNLLIWCNSLLILILISCSPYQKVFAHVHDKCFLLFSSCISKFQILHSSLLFTLNWFLYRVRDNNLVQYFIYACLVFPTLFVKEIIFSPNCIFVPFDNNQVTVATWFYFWAIYFTWLFLCLFLSQYHTVFVTMTCI